jgi:predicted HAD superfamily Cof-like phosphohydrolase
MNRTQQQVLEFHRAGGHVVNERPTVIDLPTLELRVKLIEEEVIELFDAMGEENLEAIAKELADLLYVVYGTAISYGLDMEPISDEVHRSNMTKFSAVGAYAETCDESGKSIRNMLGKTLKPPGYEPANLAPIIEQQSKGDAS